MQALQPNSRLGPYRLDRLLARGGQGQVFLASVVGRKDLPHRVVVKVLHTELAAEGEMRSMFLHEARVGAMLSHEGIARIFDYGEIDGALYLAMEYVEGPALSRMMRTLGVLPLAEALAIVADVAGALGYAHSVTGPHGDPLHIVHRDVTPQNVLVSCDGRVKLIDFGVAKSTGQDHHTRTGVLKGKLAYMAPEQFRGKVNNRTDVFALGVILHEIISGERLFKRGTDAETFAAILTDPIPPLQAPPSIREVLQPIVQRALARKPEQRYQDAQILEADLRNAMVRLGMQATASDLAALCVQMTQLDEEFVEIGNEISEQFTLRTPSGFRSRDDIAQTMSDAFVPRTRQLPPHGTPTSSPVFSLMSRVGFDATVGFDAPTEVLEPRTLAEGASVTPFPLERRKLVQQDATTTVLPTSVFDSTIPEATPPSLEQAEPNRARSAVLLLAGVLGLAACIGLVVFIGGHDNESAPARWSPVTSKDGIRGKDEYRTVVPAHEISRETVGAPPISATPTRVTLPAQPVSWGGGGSGGGGGSRERNAQRPRAWYEVPQAAARKNQAPVRPLANQVPETAAAGQRAEEPEAREGRASAGAAGSEDANDTARTGSLFLDTTPWTTVQVEDRSLGQTPIVGERLAAGVYHLELLESNGRVHRLRVRIKPGHSTKRVVHLGD